MRALYELSPEAEGDLDEIIEYTNKKHGSAQVLKYVAGLEKCSDDLAMEYGHYKEFPEIHSALRMKHCQHHYIFGLMRASAPMLVIAILYERMNLLANLEERLSYNTQL